MMSIIPVEGGQYRFRYKSGDNTCHIGIFHSHIKAEALFQVDLYVEAFTPSNAIFVFICLFIFSASVSRMVRNSGKTNEDTSHLRRRTSAIIATESRGNEISLIFCLSKFQLYFYLFK